MSRRCPSVETAASADVYERLSVPLHGTRVNVGQDLIPDLVYLHAGTTMWVLPVHLQLKAVLVICLPVIWLSIFTCCLVQGTGLQQDTTTGEAGPAAEPQTCADNRVELTLSGGSKSFLFKCPTGSKLHPVEQEVSPQGRQRQEDSLDKVFQLASSPAPTKACSQNEASLSALLTGSMLQLASKGAEEKAQGPDSGVAQKAGGGLANEQKVYKLTLGEAQSEDKQFCYTCIPAEAKDRTTPGPTCTIFVTVPRKTEAEPGPDENTGGETGGQTGGETGGQTGGETGGQNGGQTGSSPSVFNWLGLSVAGCALGLMHHL
ncbi:srs domain-containing protein [Cystoisospora suis]|uniref:Srs domain-containing protein n=1 Tax=Cystoisospora suis TaxID=483139 RepID=A0A2C6KEV9_9APIC|nr:srs domain-containing protein [Cystoisospora suis]